MPEVELNNLNGKLFESGNSDWSDFVMNNRTGGSMHNFDIVEGPMIGNPGGFINGSSPKAFGNQISFNTNEAIDVLNKYLVK